MGDAERADPCVERQQVRGHVRVQRGDHVRAGGRHQLRPQRGPERVLYHHRGLYHLLHHRHPLPRLRSEGQYFPMKKIGTRCH